MDNKVKDIIGLISTGTIPKEYVHLKYQVYPRDWKEFTFDELFEFFGGMTASRKDLSDVGIAYLHYGDIHKSNKSYINYSEEKSDIPKLDVDIDKLKVNSLIENGDIVFADASEDYESIGKSIVIYNDSGENYIAGLHTIIARDKNPYLYDAYKRYFVSDWSVRKQIMRFATGISVYGISKTNLKKIRVRIPSIDEQKKISSVLSTWDKAIELKEKLIEEKKKQKKGLMQKLLTGKVRLSGFDGEWKSYRVEEVAVQSTKKNIDNKVKKVLSCTKHDGLVDSLSYFGKQVYSDDISTYKVVENGEICYATNHIEEGSIGILEEYDAGVVSPMYTVFKVNKEFDKSFIYLILKSPKYVSFYSSLMSASVNRRGSLRWNEFKRIKVICPSKNEQEAISEMFKLVDKEIRLHQKELELLKEQKKGLMQLLLTGIVRVNTEQS